MKFKIDENLPQEVANLLNESGHQASTVIEESLGGSPDWDIAGVCKSEQRVLITLDVDFCNILVYPPDKYPGIAVIRTEDQSKPAVLELTRKLIQALFKTSCDKRLWIVQENGIRIR